MNAVRIYSQDIGMEFGIKKICHVSNEKRLTTTDGQNGLPNQDKIRRLGEKET